MLVVKSRSSLCFGCFNGAWAEVAGNKKKKEQQTESSRRFHVCLTCSVVIRIWMHIKTKSQKLCIFKWMFVCLYVWIRSFLLVLFPGWCCTNEGYCYYDVPSHDEKMCCPQMASQEITHSHTLTFDMVIQRLFTYAWYVSIFSKRLWCKDVVYLTLTVHIQPCLSLSGARSINGTRLDLIQTTNKPR